MRGALCTRKKGTPCVGKLGRKLFLLFCWLFCLIVIAAFADMVAGTFNAYTVVDGVTQLADAAQTNGAAGMVSIMFMVFAVVFGLVQKKLNLSGWKEAALGILCIVASFAVGMNCPLIFGKATWSYITFVYIFFAAVLPMWLLKQPRDYMTTFMFICMIAGAVVGLLVAHPTMNLPVFTGFNNEKLGTMFPILFVTVACGAVSGFHSLVSSGTSSKTVENEKDMLKVGYGAMILESLLAVLALCVAGAAAAADGTPAAGTPFQIFSRGVAANKALREALKELAEKKNMIFEAPPLNLCTDNGAMVAWDMKCKSVPKKAITSLSSPMWLKAMKNWISPILTLSEKR